MQADHEAAREIGYLYLSNQGLLRQKQAADQEIAILRQQLEEAKKQTKEAET